MLSRDPGGFADSYLCLPRIGDSIRGSIFFDL